MRYLLNKAATHKREWRIVAHTDRPMVEVWDGQQIIPFPHKDPAYAYVVRQYKQGAGQTQSNLTDVLCLDRRTGAILLDRPDVPTLTSQLQVMAEAT